MFFHNDVVADAQSQTSALTRRFGGKKRLEYPGLDFRRNTGAVVGYFAVHLRVIMPGPNHEPPFIRPVRSLHGLSAVDDQIEEYLIKLLGQAAYLGEFP